VITRRIGLIRRKGRTLSPAAAQLYASFVDMKTAQRKLASTRSTITPD
jgi:hypothetical protein